jgi:endonuclease/exonuclease/phosphatase family metal-dependent hydrolase
MLIGEIRVTMSARLRLFTKRFFVLLNLFFALLFLLSCIGSNLHPFSWWYINMLGLAFPFLLVILLVFLVWWLIVKRKFALISAIALLIGYKSISVFFAFHFFSSFKNEKPAHSIRVATWNVARFIEMRRNNNPGSQTRLKMMDLIREQDADIVCLQEFFHSLDGAWYANIDYISQRLNYPYHVFSYDKDGDKHFTGSVIFSRYPIIDSSMIRYPRPTLPDALIYADIKVADTIIRVYTTHLQSLQFGKSDYEKIDQIKEADNTVSNSRTIFSKIKKGITYRSIQADIIGKVLTDSPYPVLFCADLNDIPNSYTYTTIRGDMQDAFLKKGSGIGRTFNAISPTLRIDYILGDDNFTFHQFKRVLRNYSDHYMLVADVELKK